MKGERPHFEVADVLRRLRERGALPQGLSTLQRRVVGALLACRTATLGGHLERCDDCGHERPAYNSCRNRHCPKCQGPDTARWLEEHRASLLPVPYAHAVFTLPHVLAPLALQNARLLYGFLFRASAAALLELAAGPRYLGGQLGFLSILHTWGQKLTHHPHVHCLIPAGVLAADGSRWIPSRKGFLLPVRPLSRLFRGKFLALLEDAFERQRLVFHGDLAALADPAAFRRLLASARKTDWVVYIRPPFGGPDQALQYLARYTHRVAIANSRILALDDDSVTISWKDYAQGHRTRTLTLELAEFARRFLLHVLPIRFVRIRHYGFLANRHRVDQLATIRALLGPGATAASSTSEAQAPSSDAEGEAPDLEASTPKRCPLCQRGTLRFVDLIEPARLRSGHLALFDSS